MNELVPLIDDSDALETLLFGGMGSPHVWAMPHAHPTSIQWHGDFELDQITSLRLGDWIIDQFNILAISPQPGGYAGHENPTLSGNYYNSIVAGKKSYNYSYPCPILHRQYHRRASQTRHSGGRQQSVRSQQLVRAHAGRCRCGLHGISPRRAAPLRRYQRGSHESHNTGRRQQGSPLSRIRRGDDGVLHRVALAVGTMAMVQHRNGSLDPTYALVFSITAIASTSGHRAFDWRPPRAGYRLGYPNPHRRTGRKLQIHGNPIQR